MLLLIIIIRRQGERERERRLRKRSVGRLPARRGEVRLRQRAKRVLCVSVHVCVLTASAAAEVASCGGRSLRIRNEKKGGTDVGRGIAWHGRISRLNLRSFNSNDDDTTRGELFFFFSFSLSLPASVCVIKRLNALSYR